MIELGVPRGYRCHHDHPRERYYVDSGGRVICRECRQRRNRRYYYENKEACNAQRLARLKRQMARERGYFEGCRKGFIPNALLREAVEREMRIDPNLTFSEIAARGGWVKRDGKGDETTVLRALGLRADGKFPRKQLREETAERIARACHIDPWEIGL